MCVSTYIGSTTLNNISGKYKVILLKGYSVIKQVPTCLYKINSNYFVKFANKY